MSHWIKGAVVALALAGSAFMATEPAQARVHVGIGIGGPFPGPGYGPGYSPYCDRYSRWYNPYRCEAEWEYGDWDEPVFIDGFWFDGPIRTRWNHHHRREFWFRNHWREGRWGGHRHHRHHHHH